MLPQKPQKVVLFFLSFNNQIDTGKKIPPPRVSVFCRFDTGIPRIWHCCYCNKIGKTQLNNTDFERLTLLILTQIWTILCWYLWKIDWSFILDYLQHCYTAEKYRCYGNMCTKEILTFCKKNVYSVNTCIHFYPG
jgi:hypothetical protein